MFVLEALVLTFATTPVTLVLYPVSFRKRVAVDGKDFDNVGQLIFIEFSIVAQAHASLI